MFDNFGGFRFGCLIGFSAICFVRCLAVNSVVHFVYIYVVWCFVLDLFNLRFDACVLWFVLLFGCVSIGGCGFASLRVVPVF